MVQSRGRRSARMTAELERFIDRMSSSYCPECGGKSLPLDPTVLMRGAKEGDTVTFECPRCGQFSVMKSVDGWIVSDTDIPYIMNAETNSATLLHRFDPSQGAKILHVVGQLNPLAAINTRSSQINKQK